MRTCPKCNTLVHGVGCAKCAVRDICQLCKPTLTNAKDLNTWEKTAPRANYCARELARLTGVSPRTLQRCFKQRVHQSPQTWLDRRRLVAVQKMILSKSSAKHAATALHFKDPSLLWHQFKREYGVTPMQFVAGSLCSSRDDSRPVQINFKESRKCNGSAFGPQGPGPRLSRNAPQINEGLSPRENQALRLQASGLEYKQISEKLGLSRHTINNYLRSARKKLGAHNVMEAIIAARLKGSPLPR